MMRMRNDIPVSAKSRARAMRAEPTEAERKLWYALRDRRMQALKFRRQAPVGPYIVDFLCIAHRLVVEADGSQHAESRGDAIRDERLVREGYTIQQSRHSDGARKRAGDDRSDARPAMVRRALALIRPGCAGPPSPAKPVERRASSDALCGRREKPLARLRERGWGDGKFP
jgi:very-short-patch-repair endonuclease